MSWRTLRFMRYSFWLIVMGALGCGDPPPPARSVVERPAAAPVEAAPEVDEARRAAATALSDWLSGCAVSADAFARHKLYTWTHPAQIEELRARRPRLLSRAHGASGEQSLFDQAIAADDHPLARRLRRRSQRTRRFAWVTPWATRMGWEDSDYGDRLIEVTLRDGAWTALFDPGAETRWRVVDADGEPVPERTVARHPERVAAVYHVANSARPYREVVLVNEAQIERWAYATESIRIRVRADAERLRALADHFEFDAPETGEDFGQWLEAGWLGEGDASVASRYRSCLSLSSEAYVPTPTHLRAVAAAIDPLPDDEALERTGPPPRARPPQPALQTYCDPTMGCYQQP